MMATNFQATWMNSCGERDTGRPPVRHCEISYATSLCNILCSILIGFCAHLQNNIYMYNYRDIQLQSFRSAIAFYITHSLYE